jgi:hypothetical protein
MRKTDWTPSIVPGADKHDQTIYLVDDDFGKIGRSWRETDYEANDLETTIKDLLTGQYKNPIRVVAFNTAERWSEDVSEDIAHELRRRCDLQYETSPFTCRISPIGTESVITMCNCRYLCRAFTLCANWASVRLRFGP